MADVGNWAQFNKLWFKLPQFWGVQNNNKKKDEQKKTDSSSSTQEKKVETPSSFQWAENIHQESQKRQQEKLNKLNTDEAYREQVKSDIVKKWDTNNAYELWYWKTVWNAIKNDTKEDLEESIKESNAAHQKNLEDDWKESFWEYMWTEFKETFLKPKNIWRWAKAVFNTVWDTIDSWVDWIKNDLAVSEQLKKDAEALWLKGNDYLEYINNKENVERYKQERINNLLQHEVMSQDTEKEIATEREIQNTEIINNKYNELEATLNDVNAEQAEYDELKKEMDKLNYEKETWAVTWPEWDTHYYETKKKFESKKLSLEQKAALFYQKAEEFDELQKQHQIKEYELSPYMDNFYETEEEANNYRWLFADKIYRNEDGSLMFQWDQRDKDIYSVLKRLEKVIASNTEWIRDENSWDKTEWDYLKNSKEFLTKEYEVFADLKARLYANYEFLCDKEENGSWEMVLNLNPEKVSEFLKKNQDWLAGISDYLLEKKEGTEYVDMKTMRNFDLSKDTDLWPRRWVKAKEVKDLAFSKTAMDSKWFFHYDKAGFWIDKSLELTDAWDTIWDMIAQNPVQDAAVIWSLFIWVTWKLKFVTKWAKGLKLIKWAEMLNNASNIAWKTTKMTRVVDKIARIWLWVLDETLVSLPADLVLNDGTMSDLWLNIFFNGLGWFGKIESASDLVIFQKTLQKQWSPAAMKKFFTEQTELPELANKIDWNWSIDEIMATSNELLQSHMNRLISSDSHVAAWYMTQYLNKHIEDLQWENLEEVSAVTKAITENNNIWASLSKNKSKNIEKIIEKANADLAKTKDWTKILSIQNRAVRQVQSEFKAILDNFDVEKLNKLYHRKFVSDNVWQWFSTFIDEWSKATWVSKTHLSLLFLDKMNNRAWVEWLSVVEIFQQDVIKSLADGSLASSKWAKEAIKWARQVWKKTNEWMWVLVDVARVAQDNPEKASEILSSIENDWIHDARELWKWFDESVEAAEKVAAEEYLAWEKAAAEAEKQEKIKNAQKLSEWVAWKDFWKTERVEEVYYNDPSHYLSSSRLTKEQARWLSEEDDISEIRALIWDDDFKWISDLDNRWRDNLLMEWKIPDMFVYKIKDLWDWKYVRVASTDIADYNEAIKRMDEWYFSNEYRKSLLNQWFDSLKKDDWPEVIIYKGINQVRDKLIKAVWNADSWVIDLMKWKWTQVLDYAKKISTEPELQAKIAEAEANYIKNNPVRWNELDDVIAKAKEAKMQEWQNWADEEWIELEELMKKYNLEWDKKLENNAIETWLKENKWWISKEQYLKELWDTAWDWTRQTLPASQRQEIIEQYLKDKYWFDFSDENVIEEMQKEYQKISKEKIPALFEKRDIFTDKTWNEIAKKLNLKYWWKKEWWVMKWKLEDLTDEELSKLSKALNNTLSDKVEITKETIERAANEIENEISVLQSRLVDINEDISKNNIDNPYRRFSTVINNYIEDQSNINKVTAWDRVSVTDMEKRFLTIWSEDSKSMLEWFNKILAKLEPEGKDIAKQAKNTVKQVTKAAKETAAQRIAKAEQVAQSMVKETAKRWLTDDILDWVNKVLDFFEQNVPLVNKTWILTSVRKIAWNMDEITQRYFLWSLGATLDDLVKWTSNSTILKNLSKSIVDWRPQSMKIKLYNEVKWALKTEAGNISTTKLKDFAWDTLYSKNKSKWENQLKAKQVDDVVKDVVQQKVTQNMAMSVLNKSSISESAKAEAIAEEVIVSSTNTIKDSKLAKLNQKIWKQSQEAMYLYQRMIDTAALKRWEVVEDLAEAVARKTAQDEVWAQSDKIVSKQKKKRLIDKVAEVESSVNKPIETTESVMDNVAPLTKDTWLDNINKNLADSIKQSASDKAKMSASEREITNNIVWERLTEKEKTLMRFGAVDEASRIMESVSKWKKPWMIKAEFLDWEWFKFFMKLMPIKWKEFDLFYKSFIESRNKIQWVWYQLFHWIKNLMYDWKSTLKTVNWATTLNDILKAIPSRITSNIKSLKSGWVIYDPRVTLTKYIMESSPEEWAKAVKAMLNDYFAEALSKASRDWLAEQFLKAFGRTTTEGNTSEAVSEAYMELYQKLASDLRWYWVEERVIHDILNPMFYNPLEYVKWVWRSWLENWKLIDDMVMWTILRKYMWQWNNLPWEVAELYAKLSAAIPWTEKSVMDFFETFAWGSLIKNRNAMEFWDTIWRYLDKIDSIPMWKDQFAEWMNKTFEHITNLWDDVTRRVTAIDSALTPLFDKAKKTLNKEDYSEFMTKVDKFLYDENYNLKHTQALKESLDWFVTDIKKAWLYDWETQEIIEVLNKSFNVKETWESRVLANYLFERVSRRSEEYISKTWKTPDKFNLADINERKSLQDIVRQKYNEVSADELLSQIKNSQIKRPKVVSEKSKISYAAKNNKDLIENFWASAEEAADINKIAWDIDMKKLIEKGELSPEESMREILKRFVNNGETFEKLMDERWFFSSWVADSINRISDNIAKNSWNEYFYVGKKWEFILRQEWEEYSNFQKWAAHLTTRWHVMSKDRESQWIIARLQMTKSTSYVRSDIDFWKIFKKDSLSELAGKSIPLDSFMSMWKTAVYKLSKKIKRADRTSVVEEAVNRVFKNPPLIDPIKDEIMKQPANAEFINFLRQYKAWIDKMRWTLELWDIWNDIFKWVDFSKWIAENKLANRISWMWNYLSHEDISRLSYKYDKDVNGMWKWFTKDLIYNARSDLSDNIRWRALNKANDLARSYAIARNYNITNITKAGQQMASNLIHAEGILKSTAVAWTAEFDELFDIIQRTKSMKNLWFDLFETEWKFWERIMDKAQTASEMKRRYDDWITVKNLWLFVKDVATSNALVRWDRATQKFAVKSSLALAADDIYKMWWKEWVKEFTENLNKFTNLLDKYKFRERDLMDKDRFFQKVQQTLNPELANMKKAGKTPTMEEIEKYYTENKEDMKFIYDFYRNQYAPFFGKARTSMWTFFVADNIKELGSIAAVDKFKYMFWLMKWAWGKFWEYMFDVSTAFWWKATKRSFFEAIQQPIFKRIFHEIGTWMHAMREVEKATNHEFTVRDWMKATLVPVAAVSMLFWEALIDTVYKACSPEVWKKEWVGFVKEVTSVILDSVADFITDRAFIYLWMFSSDFWAADKTADVIWEEKYEEFFEAFAKTWWRKFSRNNPIVKFAELRTAGYWTDATELINPSTILAEIWLNQTSSKRQEFNDLTENIYNLASWVYEDNNSFAEKVARRVPAFKNYTQAWVDLWVLYPMLQKKIDKSWAYGFLRESTSRTEITRLINNMENNYALNNDNFKKRVKQNAWTIDMNDDNAVKMAMIRAWEYNADLQAWKIVQDWLNKEDVYWKWETALWLSMLSQEDRADLYAQFDELYQTYVIDKDKADVATTTMFNKFVKAATKYGWDMSMAGYMWAYATAYKAAARKYYWLTWTEVTAWNKWDEWLAAEWDIDLANLPDSKYGNYIKYVDTIRDFELWLIADNWDIISREKNIGQALLNKYISVDHDNFGWAKYTDTIWNEDSNLAKLANIKFYNETARQQWQPWVLVSLAYQEKKAADNYLKALDKAEDADEIASVWDKFLSIQESLWAMADKFADNPHTTALVKTSLAAWLIRFADEIDRKSPWMLEKVIDIIGEKNINRVLNTLTDSPTVTVADAFELATWVNAHPWSWSKWKGWFSIPAAKTRQDYVNKMLIPDYNRAKAAAAATWWTGDVSLPKFTTGYGRAKDGSIISAKIPVPQRKQLTELPTNSIDTRTAKLDVAPLPVKEWRVIGWKYSARAIQNAKVYSRRIGK